MVKASLFQFKNPHINELVFKTNEQSQDIDGISMQIEENSMVSETGNDAILKLTLTIGDLDKDNIPQNGIYIKITASSEFMWEKQVEDIKNKLKVNGGAVLLSYIRPLVASITMQAGLKPLHIPFIDFTERK